MNSLKPLLTVAVLAGIGYGVYIRINNGHDAPPPEVAEGWGGEPTVQLPEASAPAGAAPFGPGSGAKNSGLAPFSGPRNLAASAPPSRANEAPPYGGQAAEAQAPPYGARPGAPAYNDPAGGLPVAPEPGMPEQPRDNSYASPRQGDPAAPPDQGPPPTDPGAGYNAAGDRYRSAPDTAAAPPAEGNPGATFATTMDAARHELEVGQMAAALRQLSALYGDPQLTAGEQQQLNQVLDQVAGSVVYSTQHLLEPPYEVQPGERLEDIGERYSVPWQLLAKINGIDDPQGLRAGERLKVVRGPFKAVISLEKQELTLQLSDGSYAGRFPIGIGREHPPQEGEYAVSDKAVNPIYHGRDRAISAEDPNNPLGERWIGLGSDMGIHGTNQPENIGRTDLPGSISLSPRDVDDVYDILTVGSKVTIRR